MSKRFDTIEVIMSIGSQANAKHGEGQFIIGRPESSVLPNANGTGNIVFWDILHEPEKPDTPVSKEGVKARLTKSFDVVFEKLWAEIEKHNGVQP